MVINDLWYVSRELADSLVVQGAASLANIYSMLQTLYTATVLTALGRETVRQHSSTTPFSSLFHRACCNE